MGTILILSNSLNGLYSFRMEVVKSIVDQGNKVYISTPNFNSNRVGDFESMGCHLVPVVFNRRGMNPMADMKLLLSYYKMIKKYKPKAVLTYTVKPNIYGGIVCRFAGVPQLANITGLGDAVENGGWLQKLTIGLYKIGVGKARCIFFQNQANRDFCIRHGVNGKKIVLLPGSGVNLEYHKFQDYAPDGIIKFLFTARLLKAKGTEEFFEMACAIKAKYPQTEFQILGYVEGNYKQQLEILAQKGIVHFLGSTSDVRPYLAKVHCTVLPSYHEGMSNVNLESAANGRPVITTNVPGCRETVDDGKTGLLVNAQDTNSLIHAVEQFIAMPYSEKVTMGKEARKKVEREFDRNIVIKAYLGELNQIIEWNN